MIFAIAFAATYYSGLYGYLYYNLKPTKNELHNSKNKKIIPK